MDHDELKQCVHVPLPVIQFDWFSTSTDILSIHYENMSMQYTEIFYVVKDENFQ